MIDDIRERDRRHQQSEIEAFDVFRARVIQRGYLTTLLDSLWPHALVPPRHKPCPMAILMPGPLKKGMRTWIKTRDCNRPMDLVLDGPGLSWHCPKHHSTLHPIDLERALAYARKRLG